MKLGAMAAQLPWSLEQADLAFCHGGGLDWDARERWRRWARGRRWPTPSRRWCAQVAAAARPGDHIVCMSNGGFGGIHEKLLAALRAAQLSAMRAQQLIETLRLAAASRGRLVPRSLSLGTPT